MRCKDNSTSGRTRGLSFPCFCTFLEDFSCLWGQAVGSNFLPRKELGYDVYEEEELFLEPHAPPIIFWTESHFNLSKWLGSSVCCPAENRNPNKEASTERPTDHSQKHTFHRTWNTPRQSRFKSKSQQKKDPKALADSTSAKTSCHFPPKDLKLTPHFCFSSHHKLQHQRETSFLLCPVDVAAVQDIQKLLENLASNLLFDLTWHRLHRLHLLARRQRVPPRMAGHLDPKPIETSDVTDFFTASHGLWGKYFSEFAGKVLRRGGFYLCQSIWILYIYAYIWATCANFCPMKSWLVHRDSYGRIHNPYGS